MNMNVDPTDPGYDVDVLRERGATTMTEPIHDVTQFEELVSREELKTLLAFTYYVEDWGRGGPVTSMYELRNCFISNEDAYETINRILTALKRMREMEDV